MKNLISTVAVCLLLFNCGADEKTPVKPILDNFDTSQATLLKTGEFMTVKEGPVTGKASAYSSGGLYFIVLDPFMTGNGPDLKVYLSSDSNASQYIKLGDLKSTNGKQTYQIPANTDLSKFSFVHIWCERYTVNFGYAQLQ